MAGRGRPPCLCLDSSRRRFLAGFSPRHQLRCAAVSGDRRRSRLTGPRWPLSLPVCQRLRRVTCIDRTMMATRWPCWDQHGRARIRTREESLRHTFRACRPLRHGTHRDKFSLIRPPNHLAVCGGLEKSWQICGEGMEMLLNITSLVVPDWRSRQRTRPVCLWAQYDLIHSASAEKDGWQLLPIMVGW
jgi:hypothetical protein